MVGGGRNADFWPKYLPLCKILVKYSQKLNKLNPISLEWNRVNCELVRFSLKKVHLGKY